MHQSALQEGKTDIEKIDPKGMIMGLIRVIPAIIKHDKFNECSENKDRATAHMMVLFGFVGLFLSRCLQFSWFRLWLAERRLGMPAGLSLFHLFHLLI